MKINKFILFLLIIVLTVIMPIIPSTFRFKSINFTGDTILFLIILYFLLIFISNRNLRKNVFYNISDFFKDYINISMLVWIITMFISIIYSRDKMLACTESLRLSYYVILFFILKYYVKEEKVYKYIIRSYMLASIVIGVFGIYQSFMGIGAVYKGKLGTEIRISSLLENPNNLGMYFVFAIFPFIILSIKDKKMKNKLFYSILTILSLINIILSYSRNAFLGFAVGIIMIIVMYGIKYVIFTVIPILLLYFVPSISNRVKEILDLSQNLSRIRLWEIALKIIKDHPILGVGNGNFPKYFVDYASYADYVNYNFIGTIHPHNAFLKAFSELGLIGVFSFSSMIISSLFYLYKFIKNEKNDFYKWFYTGIFISMFSMVFMNSLDNFFNSPKVIVYYFISLGICEGIRIKQKKC